MLDHRPFLPLADVMKRFSLQTATPLEELRGPAQTREISRRRQELMWLARQLTSATLAQIGDAVGGRDAKTVDAGIDRIAMRALNEPPYRAALSDLRDAIIKPADVAVTTGSDLLNLGMAINLLSDTRIGDADARQGALTLLRRITHGA
jgi:hypothetical protein